MIDNLEQHRMKLRGEIAHQIDELALDEIAATFTRYAESKTRVSGFTLALSSTVCCQR
jgi:hypothetical protein